MRLIMTSLFVLSLLVAGIGVGSPAPAYSLAQEEPDLEATIAALEDRLDELDERVTALEGAEAESGETDRTEPRQRPTATQASDTGDDAVSPGGPAGTFVNPLPAGTEGQVGDWEITVMSTIPNATDVVMAENSFNDPPAAGNQFYIVEIAATFTGVEPTSLLFELDFQAVGQSAVSYRTFENGCGVIPNDIPSSEVFPGGMIIANVCFQVQSGDVDSLVLYIEDFFSFDSDSRVYFALLE